MSEIELPRSVEKVMVIAGASGALARAFRKELQSRGTPFITIDKVPETQLETLCRGNYHCDLLDEVATIKIFEEIAMKFSIEKVVCFVGKIHNGMTVDGLGGLLSSHDVIDIMNANFISVFNVGKAFILNCLDKGIAGSFVAFSSVNSIRGKAGQAAYAASKSALESLIHSWVLEYSRFGIRFNALAPGYIQSPSMQSNMSGTGMDNILDQIPLGRFGSTDDVNQAITFLMSSGYVNGTVLFVDGGLRN